MSAKIQLILEELEEQIAPSIHGTDDYEGHPGDPCGPDRLLVVNGSRRRLDFDPPGAPQLAAPDWPAR